VKNSDSMPVEDMEEAADADCKDGADLTLLGRLLFLRGVRDSGSSTERECTHVFFFLHKSLCLFVFLVTTGTVLEI